MSTTKLLSVLLGGMLAVGVAHAEIKWDFSNPDTYSGGANSGFGAYSESSASVTTTVTAWSNNQGTSGWNGDISGAYIHSFTGGFGVTNIGEDGSAPNHAMDNSGRLDSLLLSFTQAVELSKVQIGWPTSSGQTCGSSTCDSDISVMAYTGAGAPVLTGNTYQDLVGLGWQLVGHYTDLASKPNDTATLNTTLSSSYWLIGAFNPLMSAASGDSNRDYVKVLAVYGEKTTTTETPAPAPLALMLIAGLAGVSARRARARR